MTRFHQGIFVPKNPQKLIGKQTITYRSGWELTVMNLLDSHSNVIRWASESIMIPYINPFTGRRTVYIPDFLVYYQDKNGKNKAEIIEVKPSKEALLESVRTKRDKAAFILNSAKWRAAYMYCKTHGFTFRILTEKDIYITKAKQAKKK